MANYCISDLHGQYEYKDKMGLDGETFIPEGQLSCLKYILKTLKNLNIN